MSLCDTVEAGGRGAMGMSLAHERFLEDRGPAHFIQFYWDWEDGATELWWEDHEQEISKWSLSSSGSSHKHELGVPIC